MKRIALFCLGCGAVGGAAFVSLRSLALPKDAGDVEPSQCLSESIIQIAASPTQVTLGQSSVVNWSVVVPPGCANIQVKFNGRGVGRIGSETVTPPTTSTFSLIVSYTHLGVFQQTIRSIQIQVGFPTRVVINSSTPNAAQVLIGALGSPNPQQIVELCNVDIDMTGITGIVVTDNRTLIGSPGCERSPRRLGPRIFVTDERGSEALFFIRGDNVRFSGFRLEGPTSEIGQGDSRKEKGIVVWPFESPTPIHSIDISNMEIFHWSGLGIQVTDVVTEGAELGRLFNTNPGAVHIHGNFFHHNRHGSGDGYGVESSGGAYALIEQNVFDENRHAIAGGSRNFTKGTRDFSGYTARDNLILEGGGLHCSDGWWWAFTGWRGNCWQTHLVDMHGDQNEFYSSNNWECGTAGETLIIQRNTILYTKGLAIKIRGNPADKAVVDGNVFKSKNRGDAIDQNGGCGYGDNITNPIQVLPNNVFGADPMAQLGSCDFVGDGQKDQFMATGVTWWAKSPVTQQWRYLNTMKETLSQVVLGNFDGDAICDVALPTSNPLMAPNFYSKSGTTQWERVRGTASQ